VAQGTTGQPAPGAPQIAIWPGEVPDAERNITTSKDHLVAGKPVFRIGNVVHPSITYYAPKGENTGVAAVVFPGGGYSHLALDIEGTEVCDWANTVGITCVVLKYRVPGSGPYPKSPAALADAQRAVSLVRFHASEWHIDPHRIGVIGFSAGAHLAASLSTHFETRVYQPVDAADQANCRPDFAAVIYPGYLAIPERNFAPNPDISATSSTPPTFLVQTEDDKTAHVESSLAYYVALKNATVPVEMHLYAEGRHGYGLRRTGLPVADWPRLAETWLHTIKMLP
jgi:acetyl esterase/lipase